MLKIRKRKRNAIDIADSGALSDLAFLLIIFFIVIAVFNINKGFILGLPKKNSTKFVNVQDIVKVRLIDQGQIRFDGNSVDRDQMATLVTERLKQRPNMTFMLEIEPDVPYQEVVSMVDLIRRLDVQNFSFNMVE